MATPPRELLPRQTRLVTRRTSERRFFLAPKDKVTQQIFLYVLGLCLKRRRGFELHAFCAMANHYHLVGTDLDGNLPDFTRDFNSLLALALNQHLDRRESFWSRDPASYVHLVDADDVFEKIVYTLTNPVTAELVPSHEKWPGALSAIDSIGSMRPIVVERPKDFDPERYPPTVEIRLTIPRGFRQEDPARFRARLREAVCGREEAIREMLKREGRKFVGVDRLLGADYCPKNHAAGSERERAEYTKKKAAGKKPSYSGKNPTIAAGDKWRRIEALQRRRAFLEAYREARLELEERLAAGRSIKNIVFPAGTYLLRKRYGVAC